MKVDQEYEADENGEASLLDTESLQLDTPEDVWLYEEDGYLCLEYSHVDANDGYYVVVYKGSDRLLSVYTDVDEEQLVLTKWTRPGRANGSMPRSRHWAASMTAPRIRSSATVKPSVGNKITLIYVQYVYKTI